MARSERGARDDAPPLLPEGDAADAARGAHAAGGRSGSARSRPTARRSPPRSPTSGDGRGRPLPPVLRRQLPDVPDRQAADVRRHLLQRGARVLDPAVPARGPRGAVGVPAAGPARPRLRLVREPRARSSTTRSSARSSRRGPTPTCRSSRSTRTSSRRPCRSPKRFWQLGRAIREVIDAWPTDLTVAAVGSGHLSLELGGPRQFGESETGPDPVFDRQAIDWLSTGDIDAILENVTHESMSGAGNATHGFMDLILMMGIAGADRGLVRRRPRPVPHPRDVHDLDPEQRTGRAEETRDEPVLRQQVPLPGRRRPRAARRVQGRPRGARHALGGRVRAPPRRRATASSGRPGCRSPTTERAPSSSTTTSPCSRWARTSS